MNHYNINEITRSLREIAHNPWAMYGAFASFFVGIVASVAAFKQELENLFIKPKVILGNNAISNKQNNVFITRLKIENKGKVIARNVIFIPEQLKYLQNENKNWVPANNFIPFPFRWTHLNSEYNNLYLERPYYLDLCEVYEKEKIVKLRICSPFGEPTHHGLDDIKEGTNNLLVAMYCENAKKKIFSVDIYWSGKFESPKISSITEIIAQKKK